MENQRLKDELMMENAFSTHPTSQTAKKLIHHLENQDETYEKLINEQLSIAESLLSRECQLKQEIEDNRAAMGGIYRAEEVSVRAQRKIILLENRIHQASSAKSTAELQASQLKDHVDGLRQERRLFDELSDKMERSIAQQAQDVNIMLKKIRETHTAQVRADAMKDQIKAQMDRDARDAELEWKRLTEVIDKDRAQQVAEQAHREAERKKRMNDIIRRQKSIRSSKFQGQEKTKQLQSSPSSSVAMTSSISSPATMPAEEASMLSFVDDNDASPRDRVKQLQAKIDAVVSVIAPHCTADEAVNKLEEQKQLCLHLFSALSNAHSRIERMENDCVSSNTVEMYDEKSQQLENSRAITAHVHTEGVLCIDALCDEVQRLSERLRQVSP